MDCQIPFSRYYVLPSFQVFRGFFFIISEPFFFIIWISKRVALGQCLTAVNKPHRNGSFAEQLSSLVGGSVKEHFYTILILIIVDLY
ncbi:hypothetical protein GDO81_014247 [Engystomops pustulosus]|uniref:Uncharacterized protein n=1 Tax=Engystomops pustulosus TaxID=76066 RepID=A0AAV7B8Z9_ENGPU|nr:hypothetical protein GDO81_014247 [Engystomops pustulosus]